MNIDKIAENSAPQAGQQTGAIKTTPRSPVVERDAAASRDQVDMSMIGRLLARNVRALAESDEIRPAVLEQHQELPRQAARFDNSIIDRIFRRMH